MLLKQALKHLSDVNFSRRQLLALALGSAGCRSTRPSRRPIQLRFAVWGEPVEMRAFRALARRYEALHPDVAIEVEQLAYTTRDQVDVLIAAGVGPDVFRVQYTDIGRYGPSNALIDLSPYLPPQLGAEFTEPTWIAVQYEGRPHAVPHHTDTSAIIYNKSLFRKIGIKPPAAIEESWSWEEFIDVARAIKRSGFEFAFAVNWTLGGSFRWLNFLYQQDGCLLKDNFTRPGIPSNAALETLRWTQSFFRERLVPLSDSAKSSEQVEQLFAGGVVGMYFDVGPQALREFHFGWDWGTTFLPRSKRMASELGGNAIGVCRNTKHPAEAAEFVSFVTNESNMLEFIRSAQFLPVRKSLVRKGVEYDFHPDGMQVHLEQSKTVPIDLARVVTLPEFHRFSRILGDELDLAFTGNQSAEDTAEHLGKALARIHAES